MKELFLPAEWHPQIAVQIAWPHADTDWRDILDEVVECYIAFSKEILKVEKLIIVCQNEHEVRKHFSPDEQKNIITIEIPSNDTWARDHAAISIFKNGSPALIDFGFNGWGLKFAANHDNQITQRLYDQKIYKNDVELINKLDFILEGGAIESDGKGTLLTTSQCMLAPNRNQPMQKEEIEETLKQTFGLERVLWINHGYLAGDDTDSHVDTLVRFCDEKTIAYVQCTNRDDEHFEELQKMEKELKSFKTLQGEPYQLIPLPMADPVFYNGYRLPATYANFLIINEKVLVPFYDSPKDIIAKKQLEKAFQSREVVGINCSALIKQHGSLHCVTMQIPEGFI